MTNLINLKHSKLATMLLALDANKSYFTVVDGGRLLAKRSYNKNALMEHLLTHVLYGLTIEELPEGLRWLFSRIPKTSWCNPACAVRVFGGRLCPDSVRDMKQHIARASIAYLKDHVYTLKKYADHGELVEWKFYDETVEMDRIWAERQFEVARERREKYLDKMEAIIYGMRESNSSEDRSDQLSGVQPEGA